MSSIRIILINPADLEELYQMSRKIFYDSFNHLNTPENMQAYVDKAYNREQLLSELKDPRSEHYWICDGDRKAGFLKLNLADVQSDIHDPESLEIQRIYVDGAYQGKGLGAILLQKARERAIALNLKYIWLGVWEKNPNAIRFYQKHGFEIFRSHDFVMGDEVQTDILMKLKM